jgi:hypothetical protein
MDKSEIIAQVCQALSGSQSENAAKLLRKEYPFMKHAESKRTWSALKSTQFIFRDGFVCFYCGQRLVFPATLRVISGLLKKEFPFHPNWKTSDCHRAYPELSPTVDHRDPVTRDGLDVVENFVTACWRCNSTKSNWTLKELGRSNKPNSDSKKWDGLTNWFLEFVESRQGFLKANPQLKSWHRAAKQVIKSVQVAQ